MKEIDKIPIWGHFLIVALAIVFAIFMLIAAGNSAAKLWTHFKGEKATVGATNDAGNRGTVNGDVNQRALAARRVDTGGGNLALGDQAVVQVRQATLNNPTFIVTDRQELVDFEARRYEGEIQTDEVSGKVVVHVLWREGSWRFNAMSLTSGRLNEYLQSPTYRRDLRSADAIVCVGLVSQWATKDGSELVSDMSLPEKIEVESKSDNRAFTLCKKLSEQAKFLGTQPQFLGVGLGYHVDEPEDEEEELRQRSVLLLHVTLDKRKQLKPSQLEPLLIEVMKTREIREFEGERYSRVVELTPICFFETFHGTFTAEELHCD